MSCKQKARFTPKQVLRVVFGPRRRHVDSEICRFITNHEARKRYWARSFLGWTNLHKARPNVAHMAVKDLGNLGLVSRVITQSGCIVHILHILWNGGMSMSDAERFQ